ncbi:MAG: hypothetical protein J7M24_02855, partial [Candidatus Latescibacteria bacterium]|nr:hypothetical protein [Candidatus Latescibacterota bacterium]
ENWVWSPPGVINMHCPEKWGYVQFSTARPGTDVFMPDPTEPARNILHGIYWSQRDYIRMHGAYAVSVDALGLNFGTHDSILTEPSITLTSDSTYSASAVVGLPGGKRATVRIHQDSKVEVE